MKTIHHPGEHKPKKQKKIQKREPRFALDHSKLPEYRFMIETQFRQHGPSKSRVELSTRKKYGHPLTAGIDPDSWDVKFILKDNLVFAADPVLLRYLEKRNIVDPMREMLRDVSSHEIGHWEYPRGSRFGCPYDKPTYYTSFIEPIFQELKNSGKLSEKMCRRMSERLSNAVSDVIDNYNVASRNSERSKPYSGQVLFWYVQGQEKGEFSDEYALFVKLNLAMFGINDDYGLLSRFIKEKKELGDALSRLTKVFTPESMMDRSKWESLARAYAKEALKFITEDEPKHQYSVGDKTAKPMKGKGKEKGDGKEEGQGKDESEEEDGSGKKGEDEDETDGSAGKDEEGNGEQETENGPGQGEEGEDEEVEGSKPEEKEPGEELTGEDIEKIMGGRKAGQGIPFYIKTDRALDAYYKGLSKRIKITAAGGKLPAAKFPLIPLLREPFDPDKHSPEDVVTSKLFVDVEGRRIIPSVVTTRIPVDIPIKKEKRHLPDFMFTLIDSSGSMMRNGDQSIVPWGDRSYYHYGLLTFYGLLRFFEMERLLHKLNVSGAIFSDQTLGARGLQEVKKLLLNPVSGGTRLDIRKVLEAMKGSHEAMFSMISDGDITNWDSVKDEFIALARAHQFFMIQIGGESGASRDLKAAGLIVKPVDSHEQIVSMAIDLTARGYRDFISRALGKEANKYKEWGER